MKWLKPSSPSEPRVRQSCTSCPTGCFQIAYAFTARLRLLVPATDQAPAFSNSSFKKNSSPVRKAEGRNKHSADGFLAEVVPAAPVLVFLQTTSRSAPYRRRRHAT